MSDLAKRAYIGDGKCHYDPLPGAWSESEPYIASSTLAEAVNVALHLRRPLLVEGDPGCGKTRLAYATAYELGYPLKACYIRSTSRAQDLLYTYDAVKRLYDIQERKTIDDKRQPPSRKEYVSLGRLGEAIQLSQEDVPSVVLIDEIDKADIDFPNDLLLVLDRLQFEVDEVEGEYKFDALEGKSRDERKDVLPLIIVTSNREKELPKPFLRRCIFYYIDFPDYDTLVKIMESHFQKGITPLFEEAIKQFWRLRQQEFRWRKIPSTSELLDWVQILERDEQDNRLQVQDLTTSPISNLPYLETLVKTQGDLDALKKLKSE
ncbi:MAG: MoxR family ATPase [Chloroflexi bacterium]|nr:MoxR family ATPase [Chloroflexota bacterium]